MRITISRCWFQQEVTVWGYHCQKPVGITRLSIFLLVSYFVIQDIWTVQWKDIRRIKRSSFPQWCKILGGEKSNPVSYYYETNGSLTLCIQPCPVTGAALCRGVPASTVITARCDFPMAATQPCTTSKASHVSFSSHHLLANRNPTGLATRLNSASDY